MAAVRGPSQKVQGPEEVFVLEALADERRRLAQRLHDDICQRFSGLQLLTKVLERKLQDASEPIREDFAELRGLLQSGVDELHRLTRSLPPRAVMAESLGAALVDLAADFDGRLACTAQPLDPAKLPTPAAATGLYLMAREMADLLLQHVECAHLEFGRNANRPDELVLRLTAGGEVLPGRARKLETLTAWKVLQVRAAAIGASLELAPGDGSAFSLLARISVPPL